MHYELCITNYALRIMHYELCITNYALRIMHYELRITNYELCIMHYKSPLSDFHQKMETKGNHGNRETMETVCTVLKNDNIFLFGMNLCLN